MSVGPLYPAPLAGSPNLVRLTFRIQAAAAGGADPDFIYPSNTPVVSGYNVATGIYGIKFATVYPGFVGGIGAVMPATTTTLEKIVLIDTADYNTTTGVLTVQVAQQDTSTPDADGDINAVDMVDNDWLYLDLVFVTAASDAVVGALAALTP